MNTAKILGLINMVTLHEPADSALMFVTKGIVLKFKDLVTKLWDPEIMFTTEGRAIRLNLSHRFPNYFTRWPNYDRAIPRLCESINKYFHRLCVVDVGANVGDTVNLIDAKVRGAYLCIEPSEKFFPLLVKNTRQIEKITLEKMVLAESVTQDSFKIQEARGTATLVRDEEAACCLATLDTLVARHKEFSRANFVKIDTDGYDYKVIRGGRNLLLESKPVLFFELFPSLLSEVGNEDPLSIFPFLSQCGYRNCIFYDNRGFLLARVSTLETSILQDLVEYARRKPEIWFDVAVFHNDHSDLFRVFHEGERAAIPLRGGNPSFSARF